MNADGKNRKRTEIEKCYIEYILIKNSFILYTGDVYLYYIHMSFLLSKQ